MTKKNTSDRNARSGADLDSRYGEIGISVVAAALQFKCETKNRPMPRPRRSLRSEDLAEKAA